jgi:hypothetical protein
MRKLFRAAVGSIGDIEPVRGSLAGIPGSFAKAVMIMPLVHERRAFGALMAGRSRSQAGLRAEVFTDADVETPMGFAEATVSPLGAAVLLRHLAERLEVPQRDGSVAESPPSTLAVTAPSAPAPPPAPAAGTSSSATGQVTLAGTPVLVPYLVALAVIHLAWTSLGTSMPAAATGHGVLALVPGAARDADDHTAALLPRWLRSSSFGSSRSPSSPQTFLRCGDSSWWGAWPDRVRDGPTPAFAGVAAAPAALGWMATLPDLAGTHAVTGAPRAMRPNDAWEED